jgi:transglutaminase-like putative cysteine protease
MNRVALVVALLVAAAAVVALLVARGLLWEAPPPEEELPKIMSFVEYDEIYLYLDENGDAEGKAHMRMPPSEFSEFLKALIQLIGTDVIEGDYKESIRGSFARYGLEVKNMDLKVNTGENFEVEITWSSPRVARWTGDGWELSFRWVDDESVAKEIIAEQELSLVFIGSIAKQYGYDFAHFQNFSRAWLVLPSNAENVFSETFGVSERVEYGGGSYEVSSVYLTEVEGKPTVIENSFTELFTENELTLTAENLLENSLTFTVTYGGFTPGDKTFLGSLESPRLDLKYGLSPRESYPVFLGENLYFFSPAQLLYYSAHAILMENSRQPFSIESVIEVAAPETEGGRWEGFWKNLSKEQYLQLAQRVTEEITSEGRAPGSVDTPVGEIRFRDALYTLLRILSEVRKNGALPAAITLVPVPSGNLDWGGRTVSARYSYHLLADRYIITDTDRVNEVLNSFPAGLDNRGLAEQICEWTSANLSYGLSFTPPTSEEVLISRKGQCRDYANVYLALAKTAGLPARRVNGWVTSTWQPPAGWGFTSTTTPTGETVALHAWIQVYIPGEGWLPLDPQESGSLGALPYTPYRELEQTWMGALAGYESAGGEL